MKRTITRQRITRAVMTLLVTMLTATTAWADTWPEYITDVILVGGTESEVNTAKSQHSDYTFISQDLNAGCGSGSDYINLGYKTGYRANVNGGYITDIIVIDAEGTNPPSTVTYSGRTYYLCPYDGGSHFEDVKGNLNSNCGGGWNLYLYYTKANIGKQAVSSITVNSTKDGAINCYYTNGNSHETQIDLNRGLSGSSDVYMHLSTATKTNRPSADPVMASGLVYNNDYKQLIKTAATISSGTMYYNLGLSGSWTTDPTSLTALSAGTYTIYYYAGSNSYGNASSTHSQTVTIAKSPNSITACMSPDVIESEGPRPTVTGDNLSTGAITYQYSTSQNGTYSTTAPTTAGTYWVKATIAADDNCYEYTTPAVSFKMLPDWALHNTGDSEADAYVITTTGDLDLLAQRVNAGNAYSGKFFRLGGNITYDGTENNFTPIGVYGAPFAGTFDGNGKTISGLNINQPSTNYIGLFGMAGSAVIKNLTLANSTFCGNTVVGAILGNGGYTYPNYATVENCVVSSTVTVTADNYVGGIVGQDVTVRGCVCAATVSAATNGSPIIAGGIIGNGTRSTVSHCLYTGTSVTSGGYKGAIAGYKGSGYLSNNYYTQATISGTDEGDTDGARRAVAINTYSGVTATMTGAATTYSHSGITAYASNRGLLYNGQLYAGNVETVNLDITYDSPYEGFSLTGYTDGNGHTLTNVSGNTYKLQMPATTATITPDGQDLWGESTDGRDGSTAAKAFRITTPAGLDLLASKVNGGTDYSGTYFELGDDITYDYTGLGDTESNYTAIGGNFNYFQGHFDGKGHTVSGIRIYKGGSDSADKYQGLFGQIDNGEVKNVSLSDACITGDDHTGGIVGWNNYGTIENCHVLSTVTVLGTKDKANEHGGIVGYNIGGSIIGCTSSADVTAEISGTYYGGIAGWNYEGTIRDCLVYGGSVSSSSSRVGAITGSNDGGGTLVNNRYTGDTKVNNGTAVGHGTGDKGDIDGQATIAYQFPADIDDPSIMGTQGTTYGTGTYQGITAYENGLAYQGHLYYTSLWTGSGSDSDPYVIYSAEGLDKLATDVNGGTGYNGNYFALGADIQYDKTTLTLDLDGNGESDSNFPGIGDFGVVRYFGGSLDGRGHTISGIVINRPNMSNIGLFAKLESNQSIENLTIANSDFTGPTNVGAIVGKGNSNLNIRNCHVLSDVTISGNFAGGIVGYSANVLGCTSAATVSGITIVGGIVGQNPGYTVQDCLYLGTSVTATSTSSKYAGAIIGNSYNATMANNYYTAYGLGGVGSDSNATGTDTDGARFAVSSTTKPDAITGDATATYGTGTYTGITAYGTNGLEYDGKYYWHEENLMELADHNEDNSSVIVANEGQTCNVVLKDRTLYKDGKWNTLRLPFDVDMTDPNGPLYGATYRTVTAASISGTTLNLTFEEKKHENHADNTLIAGVPYIIKWDKAADYVDDDAHNIVNPVFTNVKVEDVGDDFWNGDDPSISTVAFLGTYNAMIDIANFWVDASVNAAGKPLDVLLLGADNTLRYAGSGASLGACRAYFLVDPASVEAGASRLTSFSIDFGEGEATAIKEIGNSQSSNRKSPDVWYSLNGVRLSGKPTQRGIYINNGKKVVIK